MVHSSKLRCPLTVRLTNRLWEVIDWVVLGPPRTLSAALEVRGHLLCKSASFCTVATPGEQCHITPSSFLPPSLLPLVLTLGKWGRRQLNLFSLSLEFSVSSEVVPLKKKKKNANSLGLNAKRSSGPSRGAVKKGLLRFPQNKTNDNGACKLL